MARDAANLLEQSAGELGDPGPVPNENSVAPMMAKDAKPVERLTLKVEFSTPMDSAALAELIAAVKIYGTVVEAKHAVLRRYSRELV